MEGLVKKPTQCARVLQVLIEADGEWISGQYFLRQMFLSQYHARLWELQQKGYDIEANPFVDEFGYKSYRLKNKPDSA